MKDIYMVTIKGYRRLSKEDKAYTIETFPCYKDYLDDLLKNQGWHYEVLSYYKKG